MAVEQNVVKAKCDLCRDTRVAPNITALREANWSVWNNDDPNERTGLSDTATCICMKCLRSAVQGADLDTVKGMVEAREQGLVARGG